MVGRKSRFGILSSCAHCFCFACIRRWRTCGAPNSLRCPVCRVESVWMVHSYTRKVIGKKKVVLAVGNMIDKFVAMLRMCVEG